MLARAVQCQPSDVALSSKVQLASPLHASAQVARTKLAGNAATFSGVPPAAAGGRAGARDLRFLRATRTCNPHRSSSRRTRSREAHGPLRVARAQHRGLRADGFSVEFRSARRESRVRDENGNARRRTPRQSKRHYTVRARSRPTRARRTRRAAVEPRVARARARPRAFSAPFPLFNSPTARLSRRAGKARHEMAGADGATEGPPDATYAALEGPRFVTASEPARQSVLSHSKSHPRMLESASTTAHSPARACAMDTSLLARPNDPRRLSLSGAPLTARDSLALTQVMPRRTSGPSALSRSSWTTTHPRDSSRSPVREIARASRSAGGRVQILAAVGEFVSREFSPARAKA